MHIYYCLSFISWQQMSRTAPMTSWIGYVQNIYVPFTCTGKWKIPALIENHCVLADRICKMHADAPEYFRCFHIGKINYFVSGSIHWWKYESCSIIWACCLDWSLGKSLGESDSETYILNPDSTFLRPWVTTVPNWNIILKWCDSVPQLGITELGLGFYSKFNSPLPKKNLNFTVTTTREITLL